jgi:hypothetical protein
MASETHYTPEPDELSSFDQMALASLADLWNNDADTVYDNWNELHGTPRDSHPPGVNG